MNALQVARDGGARRYLRGPVRRAVLIGVAETSRVDEAERACVVEEEVDGGEEKGLGFVVHEQLTFSRSTAPNEV